MADITKCSTEACPLAAKCWRKQAPSNPYQQAYGNFPVIEGKCTFYIPTNADKKVKYDDTPL